MTVPPGETHWKSSGKLRFLTKAVSNDWRMLDFGATPSYTRRMSANIAALVLAAGESRRMGEAKQLLRFGSATLLDIALAAVALPEIERCAVVLGAHEQAIRERLWLDECEIVVNQSWQEGMISSVKAGLRALGDWPRFVVVHPCDYALVERTTVAALLLRALANSGNVAASTVTQESPDRLAISTDPMSASAARDRIVRPPLIRPSFMGRTGHPIVLGRDMIEAVLALSPDVGMDAAVQAYKDEGECVETADPGILFDIDTPEDYRRALTAWEGRTRSRDEYARALAGVSAPSPKGRGPG